MFEFWNEAILPVNLIYTILLGLVIVYWLFVILGAMDLGSVDIDIDLDADIDVDLDVDTELSTNPAGTVVSVLSFLNFGKVPFMLIMSFLFLSMWVIGMVTNHYFGNNSTGFALALFFPNVFVSLIVTKLITTPIAKYTGHLIQDHKEHFHYIGEKCMVKVAATPFKTGQAEIFINNKFLLIDIRVHPDEPQKVDYGDEVIIMEEDKTNECFLVRPME